MHNGLHHYHKRKRIYLKKEPYPSKDKWKRFMDKAVYGAGIFGLIMTLPQLTNIWIDKNAAGVSAISWSAYLLGAIVWLGYGVVHKEKPIIITYSMWIILEVFIVIGTLIYG